MLEKYYKNAIDDAINSLKDDGVIILPTDTVYGLAALSSSKVAIERIYEIKNRDKSKLLPIVVNSFSMLKKVVDIDISYIERIKKYFPGPVTIVGKRNNNFDYFGADKVAVRMIKSPLINQIIDIVDTPLCLTSANISNEANIADPMELLDIFDGCVDCAFIEGKLSNKESTIIEIDEKGISLIREGIIPFNKLVEEYNNE